MIVYLLLVYNPLPKSMCRTYCWGRRGRDSYVVGFTTTSMQSVPITTDIVNLNFDQGEVYNITW